MSVPGYSLADEQRWVDEARKRPNRSHFARDRARVLHGAAWRRLAATTQVMIAGERDFPRTRMTHSLEVAQVGRELGSALGCDADLVETACLAHDLGHPPFGHNGESVLDELAGAVGGFEGNAQTLRILTRLEAKRFGDPMGLRAQRSVGLNLTRASLDAATKYPWPRERRTDKFGTYDDDRGVFDWMRAGSPPDRSSFEAQVMDWSDDVAYSVHDVEDGIFAGLIDPRELAQAETRAVVGEVAAGSYLPGTGQAELGAALDRLLALPAWPDSRSAFNGSLQELAALKNLTSELIGRFTAAAESATRAAHPQTRLTRYAGSLHVPPGAREEVAVLKAIAQHFVMQRSGSRRSYDWQRAVISELVSALTASAPDSLEPHLRPAWIAAADDAGRLRVVVDQVASLTDHSVVAWHQRLCG